MVVYIFNEILVIKKNEILTIYNNMMDLGGTMLSGLSRERQIPYDFTYTWNLKNKINKQTKQRQLHRYREQTDGCQMGRGLKGWMKRRKALRSTN